MKYAIANMFNCPVHWHGYSHKEKTCGCWIFVSDKPLELKNYTTICALNQPGSERKLDNWQFGEPKQER